MTDLEMRAADQDRERVVRQLSEHLATGRLTMPEFDERVSAAYEARTYGALDQLLRDLPREELARPAAASVAATAPRRKRDHGVWASWLATSVIVLFIYLMTSLGSGEAGYFWPMWVIGPWGLLLAIGTAAERLNAPRPTQG
ncbi:DUF1707 SHOCT-like domain-containing protein [Tenggerimyces flavus]|uniref:DUF1707 domain-containing protein n=1 Tax=Tenggerimyces flavus TaxID=1708749 RepID=A0ABV7Y8I4_9ACTN|nr:DUF1707 domain-containing protein [Tenggerimyces flavus]MBM7791182.1 putative coiled-coil protein SlyX [Tenggerimyces flavus]